MTTSGLHIVWFKRDLRSADHAPLLAAVAAAREAGRGVLPLYILEPDLWRRGDMSGRQWGFVRESLADLRRDLAARGQPLVLRAGPVVNVLAAIHRAQGIAGLWSHRETGTAWSWGRDAAVAAWARDRGIPWIETGHDGVLRGAADGAGWVARWSRIMAVAPAASPVAIPPATMSPGAGIEPGPIPDTLDRLIGRVPDICPGRQSGGRRAGEAAMQRFFDRRLLRYRRGMASPTTAGDACSRLSPHLAWGTLSTREVMAAAVRRRDELRDLPPAITGDRLKAIDAFTDRLRWRGRMIQGLESRPDSPHVTLDPAFEGLRGADTAGHLDAWSRGETGWPMVDACMRALARDGWLSFRMRAMLMAVASYHLWLDFRPAGTVLARCFVDYEPGIHWAQAQMQAGTTGSHAFRMVNPVRQSEVQDPDGGFIRAMLPALARLPAPFIHAPWTAPQSVLTEAGITLGRDYPAPIADPLAAARVARDRLSRALHGTTDTSITDSPDLIPATAPGTRKPRPARARPQPEPNPAKLSPAKASPAKPATRRRKTDPRQLGFDF